MEYIKTVHFKLTEAQHEVLRGMAFRARVSMVECVRGWLDGGREVGVVSKPVSESVKAKLEGVKVVPKPYDSVSKALGREVGEVIQEKCKRCFESFPVNMLITEPRSGKKFCPDCVENIKGGS